MGWAVFTDTEQSCRSMMTAEWPCLILLFHKVVQVWQNPQAELCVPGQLLDVRGCVSSSAVWLFKSFNPDIKIDC